MARDSGYKQVPSGNIQTDFVWGNMAPQTNIDRGVGTPAYNATGGGTGDKAWGTTTDIQSGQLATNDISVTANQLTLKAFADSHVNYVGNWEAFPGYQQIVGWGDNNPSTSSVTGASVSGSATTPTTVTYTTIHPFVVGQLVTITGLSNSVYNISGVIATVTAGTSFTLVVPSSVVPNTTATLTTQTGTATVYYNTSTLTAASGNGTTVTYTGTNTFVVGQLVSILGFTGTTFNLSNALVATASSTQFTVTAPISGTATIANPVKGASAVAWYLGTITTVTAASASGTTAVSYTANTGSTATVTAASNATVNGVNVVTYVANNTFNPGNTVSISGITGTTAYNLSNVSILNATPTQFTVQNAASGTAVTGQSATATASSLIVGQPVNVTGLATSTGTSLNLSNLPVATANATGFTLTNGSNITGTSVAGAGNCGLAQGYVTATVPSIIGKTAAEADRLIAIADLNTGVISYTTTGALAQDQSLTVTGASNSGGTVTYVTNTGYAPVAGQTISVYGLPTAAFNLQNVTVATGSSTGFTVTNAATGTTVTGFVGTSGTVTAASSDGTNHTYTAANTFVAGQTVTISGLAYPGYNGTFTVIASGLSTSSFKVTPTSPVASGISLSSANGFFLGIGASARIPQNANLVATQSIAAGASNIQSGTAINYSIFAPIGNESAGTQAGTFTYTY